MHRLTIEELNDIHRGYSKIFPHDLVIFDFDTFLQFRKDTDLGVANALSSGDERAQNYVRDQELKNFMYIIQKFNDRFPETFVPHIKGNFGKNRLTDIYSLDRFNRDMSYRGADTVVKFKDIIKSITVSCAFHDSRYRLLGEHNFVELIEEVLHGGKVK